MNAERVGGVFWVVFALLVIHGSYRLGLGSLQAPGSGFLGFLAGAFVLLMALVVLIQSFLGRQQAGEKLSSLWRGINWRKPLVVALLVLAYNLALERLGFILTALVFFLIMLRGVEKFSWLKTIVVAITVVACSYLLFHTFLKVSLPQGLLEF